MKENHQIKLSVITVCYNEKKIRRTCESIVNQTWQDFEWIVVDGGSTDGTLDILNEYKDRIDVLISEKDNGIYHAMNKGIKVATGVWLNFMNGGDSFYDSLTLENIFKEKDYDASILYGDYNLIPNNEIIRLPNKIDLSYWAKGTIGHQASFIQKTLFDKYGLYDESYRIAGDYEKFCIFFKGQETFMRIDACIANFDGNGISSAPELRNGDDKERNIVIRTIFTSEEIKILTRIRKHQPLFKTVKRFVKSYFLFPWYIYKTYKIISKR